MRRDELVKVLLTISDISEAARSMIPALSHNATKRDADLLARLADDLIDAETTRFVK
jgi:hypothetical protein